jgi:tripartite-type tricarboxylate transporter receptor subunit TctC
VLAGWRAPGSFARRHVSGATKTKSGDINMKNWLVRLLLAAGCSTLIASPALAEYPEHAITLVTPFAPGGGSDLVTRVLAEALTRHLGEKVIVQNFGGAGGIIGTQHVASSAPDGYTLLLHHTGLATAPALYSHLTFDPVKSFADVGLFADTPMIIVSSNSLPAHNMKELADYVRKNKEKVTFASSGSGSATHLCALLFQKEVGAKVTMVQYKGSGPALLDVQANRVDLLCDVTASMSKYITSGSVRGYVLTTDKRLPTLKDLPSSDEVGMPDLKISAWYGLYAPAGTPQPVIDKLSKALAEADADPQVKERLAQMDTTLFDSKLATPDALHQRLTSQIAFWTPIIEAAGVKPN